MAACLSGGSGGVGSASIMELTLSQRKAVTRAIGRRYRAASRAEKAAMLDQLCAVTGWHRDHARRALRVAVRRQPRRPRRARAPVYGEDVLVPLRKIWAVMDAPSGKRMAPFMAEMVAALERHGELELTDQVRAKLLAISAATIDRRLAADRARLQIRGRSGTKPGSLLKSQIPVRTWADWDDQRPGFVEIDLVGHEGGNPKGVFCQTLTCTDIATGWTENVAVANKAKHRVRAGLARAAAAFPFPILGIDSDNGTEFINFLLLAWCTTNRITFTRSRPGNKNDNGHVEQKNWATVRQVIGYHRHDTPTEVELLNGIYAVLRLLTNFFTPQQKLTSKTRHGATVTKRHDTAATPYQRVQADPRTDHTIRHALRDQFLALNPAQLRRDLLALQDQLHELVKTKHQPRRLPAPKPPPQRAKSDEATKPRRRAS